MKITVFACLYTLEDGNLLYLLHLPRTPPWTLATLNRVCLFQLMGLPTCCLHRKCPLSKKRNVYNNYTRLVRMRDCLRPPRLPLFHIPGSSYHVISFLYVKSLPLCGSSKKNISGRSSKSSPKPLLSPPHIHKHFHQSMITWIIPLFLVTDNSWSLQLISWTFAFNNIWQC